METFITTLTDTILAGFNEVFSQLNYTYSAVFILTVLAVRSLIKVTKNKTLFTFLIGAILAVAYSALTDCNYSELLISIPFSMVFVGFVNRRKWTNKIYNRASIGGENPIKDDPQGPI